MKTKRYIEYDLMRIIACFCVIMIHAAVFDQQKLYTHTSLAFQASNIFGTLSRWAVPAFVMLSGMMIIPHADEVSFSKLFFHRVLRMMGTYFVWSAIYSAYNVFVLKNNYAGTALKTWIDGCFSGEIHMWYLPMLAGLYIASPILAVIVKRAGDKWTKYWLVCMFVFSSLIPFLVKLDIKFISVIINSITGYMDLQFMGGWTLYFVLGYYLQNNSLSKNEKVIIYLVGLMSFIYTFYSTVLYSVKNGHSVGVLPYEYPNIVFMSTAVVLFFKDVVSQSKIIRNKSKLIQEVSELTFGIYLVHVLLLKVLYYFGVNIQLIHPIVSIPLLSFVVFVVGGCITKLLRKIPVVGTYFF